MTLCHGLFLASGEFCRLLIRFVNRLDPEQDRQNVGPDLDPIRLALCYQKVYPFEKSNFEKKKSTDDNKCMQAKNKVSWAGPNTTCYTTIKRISFDLIGGSEKGRFNAIQHQSRLSSTAGCHQRGSSHQSSQRPTCRRRRKLEPVAVAV